MFGLSKNNGWYFPPYQLDIGQFGSPLVLGTRRCRFKSCYPDFVR
uniref:Uncharacterized protein n=1 Tax=Siphoviridae sp. ctCIv11 TaxID=2827806 RepID=A0A8S5S249_9CAUD|nr:MAG TPA: hypothetical protein [Siphoviridae sp. ctCIv11]